MVSFELNDKDIELYESASRLLLASHHPDNHRVAAAFRGESGQIHLGLHLGSKRVNICAESSAIANARMAHEPHLHSAVAVTMNESNEPQITNPCGVCRELMSSYAPELSVIVDASGKVGKVQIQELLPMPWMRTAENPWKLEAPRMAPLSN